MTSSCRAKDPSTCRYHGSRSNSYAQALRDKLIVAHTVYKAAEGTSKWEAYSKIREAEVEYYATDQGQNELETAIEKADDVSYKEQLVEIQKRSNEMRNHNEVQDANSSLSWHAPISKKVQQPLPMKTILSGSLNEYGQMIYLLSNGKTKDDSTFDFHWNAGNGTVSFQETDDTGELIQENSRILGRAAHQKEAVELATRWFNRSVLR